MFFKLEVFTNPSKVLLGIVGKDEELYWNFVDILMFLKYENPVTFAEKHANGRVKDVVSENVVGKLSSQVQNIRVIRHDQLEVMFLYYEGFEKYLFDVLESPNCFVRCESNECPTDLERAPVLKFTNFSSPNSTPFSKWLSEFKSRAKLCFTYEEEPAKSPRKRKLYDSSSPAYSPTCEYSPASPPYEYAPIPWTESEDEDDVFYKPLPKITCNEEAYPTKVVFYVGGQEKMFKCIPEDS